jgi:hypothetical protein
VRLDEIASASANIQVAGHTQAFERPVTSGAAECRPREHSARTAAVEEHDQVTAAVARKVDAVVKEKGAVHAMSVCPHRKWNARTIDRRSSARR